MVAAAVLYFAEVFVVAVAGLGVFVEVLSGVAVVPSAVGPLDPGTLPSIGVRPSSCYSLG